MVASVSREKIFQLFMDLIEPVGRCVDVALGSSYDVETPNVLNNHTSYYRSSIDMSVLQSLLWNYENILTNDGCAGITVLNPSVPCEVQFDEHKLFLVDGGQLMEEFEKILRKSVIKDKNMQFITNAEHIHCSCDAFRRQFFELVETLGAVDDNEHAFYGDKNGDEDDHDWESEGEKWKDDEDIDLGETM